MALGKSILPVCLECVYLCSWLAGCSSQVVL